MLSLFPNKLKLGDEIRVIAPAMSLKTLSEDTINLAIQALQSLGLKVKVKI